MKDITYTFFQYLKVLLLLIPSYLNAQSAYQYNINLEKVENDQLRVDLIVPSLINKSDTIIFRLPKIIPGTYAENNFGRFVVNIKFYTRNGSEIISKRTDINTWYIPNDSKLYRLTYYVNDTWDSELPPIVFEPAGSNFDSNYFVLNAGAYLGYFEGFIDLPILLNIKHSKSILGITSLSSIYSNEDEELYAAKNYNELVDSPILYGNLDTASIHISDSKIIIAINSGSSKYTAAFFKQELLPIINAYVDYFGGALPVDYYSILIDVSPTFYKSKAFGALEHNFSTLICINASSTQNVALEVKNILAHEFFHIVIPLYIHDTYIQNFNFNRPLLSEFIWFYEGVTEYTSLYVQLRAGIIDINDFLNRMTNKLHNSLYYVHNIPLSKISTLYLNKKYAKQYGNVYEYGAIVAWTLDLYLRQNSTGQYGLPNLLHDLSELYGEDTAFESKDFFKTIDNLTSSEVHDFFSMYINDTLFIPYKKILYPFGLDYNEKGYMYEISPLAGIENGAVIFDSKGHMVIKDTNLLDTFGKDILKLKTGDIILSWAGINIENKKAMSLLMNYISLAKKDDFLVVKILRKTSGGEYENIELTAKLEKVMMPHDNVFMRLENLTMTQARMYDLWLNTMNR